MCAMYSLAFGAKLGEVAENGICDDSKYAGGYKVAMVIEYQTVLKKSSDEGTSSPNQKVFAPFAGTNLGYV